MRRKISKVQVAKNRALLKVIMELPDYRPTNPACSVEALLQLDATLQAAESSTQQVLDERARVDRSLVRVMDVENNSSQQLHERLMDAKQQIIAQYGSDSYVVNLIGLKRLSEYKHPQHKPRNR